MMNKQFQILKPQEIHAKVILLFLELNTMCVYVSLEDIWYKIVFIHLFFVSL